MKSDSVGTPIADARWPSPESLPMNQPASAIQVATSEKESAPVVAAIIFWLRCKAGWRYADEAPPPAQTDEPMVENEETARRIMQEVLDEYGSGRIMHPNT
ncbi:hypothetical protein [Paraburkholderia youngii]|uniref:hypothetical protein n=1 Tax=Paraburkholderia youngii TaxID=2782701 RepID=UPI003D2096B4